MSDTYRTFKRIEYARRWHARVTRMYRWALAHARAEREWARSRHMRRHALAVAQAYARELALTGQDASKSRRAWAEIYFEQPGVYQGVWEWTVAEGPHRAILRHVS